MSHQPEVLWQDSLAAFGKMTGMSRAPWLLSGIGCWCRQKSKADDASVTTPVHIWCAQLLLCSLALCLLYESIHVHIGTYMCVQHRHSQRTQ